MEVEAEVETNALGLTPDWYRQEEEAPVEEPVESRPPASLPRSLKQFARPPGKREWPRGEAGYAKGLEEGKLEGLQQGHAAGLEQGRRRGWPLPRAGGSADEPLAGAHRSPRQPAQELDGAVEQQLIALVMQLARALIRHEAETSPRLLLEALKQGLALLFTAELGSL